MEEQVKTITDEIISRAKLTAESIKKKADEEFEAKQKASNERYELALNKLSLGKEELVAETIRRKTVMEGLTSRMGALQVKQEAAGKVYMLALEKLQKVDRETYGKFFSNLLISSIEDGDVIKVASKDKDRLTSSWAAELIKRSGKKASFDETTFEGIGGVKLSGQICEKDFTLETILSEVKEKTEKQVMEILFG